MVNNYMPYMAAVLGTPERPGGKRHIVGIMDEVVRNVREILGPVYLVGGSVRDLLLGKDPKDYDFTTPLTPDEIEAGVRASGRRPFVTGKRFGTVGFKLGELFIEVTTFRTETYGKSRKPEVEFVSDIAKDLSRRDFTINAMALRDHRYIDPFGGRTDLQQKIIRSVGNPALRFNEDPLRMLRAARFAAALNFAVESKTLRAITHHAHKIMRVSHERWMQELDKILLSDHADIGLHILASTDLLKFLLPELRLQVGFDQRSPYHNLTLWEHSISTMLRVPQDINLRWAALLHDIGKPFVKIDKKDRSNYTYHDIVGAMITYGIAARLRWSNGRTHEVVALVRNHLCDPNSPISEADALSTQQLAFDSTPIE